MSKNFYTLGIVMLIAMGCLLCSGMAENPQEKPAINKEISEKLIDATLSNIEVAYNKKSAQEFVDFIDKDYAARLEFNDGLQSYFFSVKELEIKFVIDSVLTTEEEASVRLHWFRKIVDNAGVFSKTEGNSQFIFKRYPEGLKLLSIHQDNPFF